MARNGHRDLFFDRERNWLNFDTASMKRPRRWFLHVATWAVALPAILRIAAAYPTGPVRIIVGYAAGGAFDITARIMGQWLSERLHQPFVVENRTGAGGTRVEEAVAQAHAWNWIQVGKASGKVTVGVSQ
jgi:tripartite-type tricarboxylate transporter receptor subunit TctC